MPEIEIEKIIASSFISPNQARRILETINKEKGRKKLLKMLPHSLSLDARHSCRLPTNTHTADNLFDTLNRHGSPKICYIMSEHSSIDGMRMPLYHALDYILSNGYASILSCIPNKLGLYFNEDCRECYLLLRK